MAKHPVDRAERRTYQYRDLFGAGFRHPNTNKCRRYQFPCGRKINRVRRHLISDDENYQEAHALYKMEIACINHSRNFSEVFYAFAKSWWKSQALLESTLDAALCSWHKVVKSLPPDKRLNYVMPTIYCDSRYSLPESLGYVGRFFDRVVVGNYSSYPFSSINSFDTVQYYTNSQEGMPFVTSDGLLLLRSETGRRPLYHISHPSNYAFIAHHEEIAATVPEDDYLNSEDCSTEEVDARQNRERQALAGMTLDQYRTSYLPYLNGGS